MFLQGLSEKNDAKQDAIYKLVKSVLDSKHTPCRINKDLDCFTEESEDKN